MNSFFDEIGSGAFGRTPNPDFQPPSLKREAPSDKVPEQDVLLQVQRNLMLAMEAERVGHETSVRHHMQIAYKSLNHWLKEHC